MIKLNFLRKIIIILCSALFINITAASAAIVEKLPSGVTVKEKFSYLQESNEDVEWFYDDSPYYYEYLDEILIKDKTEPKLNLQSVYTEKYYIGDKIIDSSDIPVFVEDYEGYDGKALFWNEKEEYFEWEIIVPETGIYQIEFDYYIDPKMGTAPVRALYIDGEIPFQEAKTIEFDKFYTDDGEVTINNIGDEKRPDLKYVLEWRRNILTDGEGIYNEPFLFYFEAGKHTVRLNFVQQPLVLGKIYLTKPEDIPSYQEVLREYMENGYEDARTEFKFQAETNMILRNDSVVRIESTSDPSCEPLSYGYRKYNVVGGSRWSNGNQSVTWEFDVPEDGLYKIGINLNQTMGTGLPVYRQIKIDGKIPFKEMEAYKFVYSNGYRIEELHDENGEPYLFCLSKGRHTITMTVKAGEYRDIIYRLLEDSMLLSDFLLEIQKIIGSDPDVNYNYRLEEVIPDLMTKLEYFTNEFYELSEMINLLSENQQPSEANTLLNYKLLFERMIKNPQIIPRLITNINTAQAALGSWYYSFKRQPLVVDWFKGVSKDTEIKSTKGLLFKKIKITMSNFITSFIKDYNNIGTTAVNEDAVILDIWSGMGREWSELLLHKANEVFTPETNIAVNMSVVPTAQINAGGINALLLRIATNDTPDVAIGSSSSSAVEFAIREAVYNLKEFPDFYEVENRFVKSIMRQYEYRGGTYALPLIMNFVVMAYRKDIISTLGIKIPKTWEELINFTLPVLHQNNMQFFLPHQYITLIFQAGGDLYNQEGTKSALDSKEAYKAFKMDVDFYQIYGVPVSASFFNRFRTGEMPIGIMTTDMYIQTLVAAPELAGRWDIAPIPGSVREDGSIDYSFDVGNACTANIILSQTEHPKEAWEFLKWWTGTNIQAEFGEQIEAVVGTAGRWATANVEAFSQLPWDVDHLSIMEDIWQWAKVNRNVLGGYFTSRHITNAWTSIFMDDMPVRDALEKAVVDINIELMKKQIEYGVYDEE